MARRRRPGDHTALEVPGIDGTGRLTRVRQRYQTWTRIALADMAPATAVRASRCYLVMLTFLCASNDAFAYPSEFARALGLRCVRISLRCGILGRDLGV